MDNESSFVARRWETEHAEAWRTWIAGPESSRLSDFQRLATAVKLLAEQWANDTDSASAVVRQHASTLGRCNELFFDTEAETLAYAVWHLIDRYGRILQVMDELLTTGHLPIRQKRMSVLEVGAGPSPATYAATDFYQDLRVWSASLGESKVDIRPVTDVMLLDRGPAWGHLIHNISEMLVVLGEDQRQRPYGVNYNEFESFSVRSMHLAGVERATRWLISDADASDEYLSDHEARSQALRERNYPPGRIGLIVMCNFLTQDSMTKDFARKIETLAASLTPGGVLLAIGSRNSSYDAIFDELTRLVTSRRQVVPLLLNNNVLQAHANDQVRNTVQEAILDCLRYFDTIAPAAYNSIREALPSEVKHPGSQELTFPSFQVAAFKNMGTYRKS